MEPITGLLRLGGWIGNWTESRFDRIRAEDPATIDRARPWLWNSALFGDSTEGTGLACDPFAVVLLAMSTFCLFGAIIGCAIFDV